MKTYTVSTMTHEGYADMMNGGYHHSITHYLIEAENASEAIDIAKQKYPDLIILDSDFKQIEMEREAQELQNLADEKNMTGLEYLEWERIATVCNSAIEYLENYEHYENPYRRDTVIKNITLLREHSWDIPTEKIIKIINERITKFNDQVHWLENMEEYIKSFNR